MGLRIPGRRSDPALEQALDLEYIGIAVLIEYRLGDEHVMRRIVSHHFMEADIPVHPSIVCKELRHPDTELPGCIMTG